MADARRLIILSQSSAPVMHRQISLQCRWFSPSRQAPARSIPRLPKLPCRGTRKCRQLTLATEQCFSPMYGRPVPAASAPAHMIRQLSVDGRDTGSVAGSAAAVCCQARCSSRATRSSNSFAGRYASSSSSSSCGSWASSSQKGQTSLACQSPCCGAMWLAMARGADTTCFSSPRDAEVPGACQQGYVVVPGSDAGESAAAWGTGTSSRSSQTMWPSQKSHMKAMS